MGKFHIDSLGDLARQMEFTPQETRSAQVAAAEELLHAIDPLKAYPLDFVIFRITGYRPKAVAEDLLTGIALQHDLGLLVERVSDTLDLHVTSLREPVLQIDDVTERFNVTSKTIQRWRRKGLPSRRFIFPDGKRRVGFLLSSVERFFSAHRDQVARGTNFSQVDEAERLDILNRARRLAVHCRCCSNEISRRIGLKLNRSPATILHTIRKHDQENPAEAIFPLAAEPLSQTERSRIVKGYRRGLALSSLARRACRPRSTIYRVILSEQIERLSNRKIKFVDDSLFHEPDAATIIAEIARQQELSTEPRPEDARIPRDLPPYLQALYRTPLLSPARERALFLKFNYHKFGFVTARRRLDPQMARSRHLQAMENCLRDATQVKNEILQANLRLVVSVARKHLRPGLSLMELISEGNLTLMRAVESFDAHRGFRFSTYATLALMKGFARSVPQMLAARGPMGMAAGMLETIPDPHFAAPVSRMVDREHVHHLLARLDEHERDVLRAHYGLADRDSLSTFDEVAQRLGLSRQRVRQIEQRAIAKLRRAESGVGGGNDER